MAASTLRRWTLIETEQVAARDKTLAAIQRALEGAGVRFVGDDETCDIAGARGAGMHAVRAAAHGDINLLTILPAATEPGLQVLAPGSGLIMCAPVSVCHQVSTIGVSSAPNTVRYQRHASGLIGSPTEPSRRRLERL